MMGDVPLTLWSCGMLRHIAAACCGDVCRVAFLNNTTPADAAFFTDI